MRALEDGVILVPTGVSCSEGQGCSWWCYTLLWGVEARDTSRPTVMPRIVHGNTDFACPLRAGDDIACYKFVSVKSRLRGLPGDPGCHD